MEPKIKIIIRSPLTTDEFDNYYTLRWQVLRAPWNKDKGSEKDELEDESIHRIAILNKKIIAVARLHFINNSTAQIRYMAVDNKFTKKSIGRTMLEDLEQIAIEKNMKTIILNARETALGFYKKRGYEVVRKSHLLFDEILHFEMNKSL